MFQADGWKMVSAGSDGFDALLSTQHSWLFRGQDYGGHDSSFHDNVVYHDHGDGQNCVNAGTFLPGHGVGWYNNKCVVTDSKNIGTTGGCDCPGSGKPGPGGGQAPQGECGLTMQ